jgi:uncharacterized protein
MADEPRPMSAGWRVLTWTLAAFALVVVVNLAKMALTPAPEPAPESAVATPTNSAVAVSLPGQPAWLRYAGVVPPTRGKARIAIVMDGLGPDRARTARATRLPPAVTLSFLDYGGALAQQTGAARKAGHELLLHLPVEPVAAAAAAGAYPLGRNMPKEELLRRVRWDLERFDSYVGVDNHMGRAFAADQDAMSVVMRELKSRGLMFFDTRSVPTQQVAAMAGDLGVSYVARDIFLDGEEVAGPVQLRLGELETLARQRGTAIAVAHPHDATFDALIRWLPTLDSKGLVLVPLTDIVKVRAGAG